MDDEGEPTSQGPGVVLRESAALRQRPSPPECTGLGARLLKPGTENNLTGSGLRHGIVRCVPMV